MGKASNLLAGSLLVATLLTSSLRASDDERGYGDADVADEHVVWAGEATAPKAPLTTALGDTLLVPRLTLKGHVHQTTGFPVDRDLTPYAGLSTADLTIRPSLMWTSLRASYPVIFKVDLEADLHIEKAPPSPIEGDGTPGGSARSGFEPRKASVALSYKGIFSLSGGFGTSQWGMGLLANDGTSDYHAGNASFVTPHGGDVVIRTALALGPFSDAFNFRFSAAYDVLWRDDTLLDGDEGFQAGAAVTLEPSPSSKFGVYVVRRHVEATEAIPGADGRPKATDVWVVDLAGFASTGLGGHWTLEFEGEIAIIFGETQLAPTTDFPVHGVLQLGAAARLTINAPDWGFIVDAAYASGDRNFDDGVQNGFKADTNYQLGFIFYQSVMAAITARASHTAADPELVGYPNQDLDRIATRGGLSNTIALYPRAWWRPAHGFDLFFGTLIALSNVEMADPSSSRLAGGQATNAFQGRPGGYQGTEINMGLRYSALLFGSEVLFGLDAGVFIPGDALDDDAGDTVIDPVYATRFTLRYRL